MERLQRFPPPARDIALAHDDGATGVDALVDLLTTRRHSCWISGILDDTPAIWWQRLSRLACGVGPVFQLACILVSPGLPSPRQRGRPPKTIAIPCLFPTRGVHPKRLRAAVTSKFASGRSDRTR